MTPQDFEQLLMFAELGYRAEIQALVANPGNSEKVGQCTALFNALKAKVAEASKPATQDVPELDE